MAFNADLQPLRETVAAWPNGVQLPQAGVSRTEEMLHLEPLDCPRRVGGSVNPPTQSELFGGDCPDSGH